MERAKGEKAETLPGDACGGWAEALEIRDQEEQCRDGRVLLGHHPLNYDRSRCPKSALDSSVGYRFPEAA